MTAGEWRLALVAFLVGSASILLVYALSRILSWARVRLAVRAAIRGRAPEPVPAGHEPCPQHDWLELTALTPAGVSAVRGCSKCRLLEGGGYLVPAGAVAAAKDRRVEQERQRAFVEQDMEEIAATYAASVQAGRITLDQIRAIYNAGATLRSRYVAAAAMGIDRDVGKASS
jgi:hypothetical protein